jgi:hypothetical protein
LDELDVEFRGEGGKACGRWGGMRPENGAFVEVEVEVLRGR